MHRPLRVRLLAGIVILSLFGCASRQTGPDALSVALPAEQVVRNLATIDSYYAAAEALDIEAFADVWADDGRFLVPWLPALDLVGKDAIRKSFAQRLAGITKISATRHLTPMASGDQVFVRAEMAFQYTNGRIYSNTLVALFTLDSEGKIVTMEEWLDLETFRRTFGDLPGR